MKPLEKEIMWFIEKWFENHTVMTNENYAMLQEMAYHKYEEEK